MSLEISLRGKKVIVTGAGRGIGKAIVEKLHNQDAIVYAISRTQSNLDSLKAQCPNIEIITVDLENWDETRKAIESIGPVDCLVNNAAVLLCSSILETTKEDFLKMINTNVTSALNICQVVAKGMIKTGSCGSIVNISTMSTAVSPPGLGAYATSKSALDRLSQAMAVELGQHGIRVNTVHPTLVKTDMSSKFIENKEAYDDFLNRTPLGRVATADEIVNTVLFLLSDLAPMITGDKLFVDGGYRCN